LYPEGSEDGPGLGAVINGQDETAMQVRQLVGQALEVGPAEQVLAIVRRQGL
jgi:hypothetical protein